MAFDRRTHAIKPPIRAAIVTIACSMLLGATPHVQENTRDLIDALRTRDCAEPLSSTQRLHANAALDAAAQQVMEGRKIDAALTRAGLRVTRSAVIRISGNVDATSLEHMLIKNH